MGTSNIKSLGAVPGTPWYEDVQSITTPGVEQTLFTFTVPTGTTRVLHHFSLACKMDCRWFIEVDGTVVGSGYTGPGQPTDNFFWYPGRKVQAGKVVRGKAYAIADSPPTTLDSYLQTADLT